MAEVSALKSAVSTPFERGSFWFRFVSDSVAMQKKPSPSKTRSNTGVAGNRNASGSSDSAVPILGEESELFGARLSEVIGAESKRSFAKRCSLSDGLLGAYLRGEKFPGVKHLVTMADAGSVTVEWLATGREPRTRAELSALLDRAGAYADSFGPTINKDRLLMAIRMATGALAALNEPLTAERQSDLVKYFYDMAPDQEGSGQVPKPAQK